jgi:hypothetical protein
VQSQVVVEGEAEGTQAADGQLAAVDLSAILDVFNQSVSSENRQYSGQGDVDSVDGRRQEIKADMDESALDRFIDLKNLAINEVELKNAELLALKEVVRSDSFNISLDRMGDTLDEAFAEEDAASRLSVASAASIVVGVSAGLITQLLRAGSLFASFLSVVPLWRQFDPLPILTKTDDDEEDQENQEEGQGDEANVTTEPVEPETDERDEFEALFDQSIEEDD